jgi:hypothetical protein
VRAESCRYLVSLHIYLSLFIFTYLLLFISILTDFTYMYLVSPSCLCGIVALRSHDFWEMTLTAKHVFGLFTFYQRFCTTIFFIWNKIFIQPRGKYFTYINQKCYFLLWLFQLRWTLIQHFQVFHVNKPNTFFAVSHLSKVMWPQSENTTKTTWRD